MSIETQKSSLSTSPLFKILEVKKNNAIIINKITENMKVILGREVWNDFNFKSGKVMGIMRTIGMNRNIDFSHIIPTEYIDLFFEYGGNLPYIDKTTGQINEGRPMNPKMLIELLKFVYTHLGMEYTDTEFNDITQERWDKLYQAALERAKKNEEFNKEEKIENKEEEIKYEE